MSAQLFGVQRIVGEELLALGWHASSIAVGSKPGSAWVLQDPSRRIRVRMCADLAHVLADVTAASVPSSPHSRPLWRLTIHHAPVTPVVAALNAVPDTTKGSAARNRRAVILALTRAGMQPDRSPLVAALSGVASWSNPGRDAEVTWTAPRRTDAGGWQILTPTAHLDATPTTPAAVLTPLIIPFAAARKGGHP